MAPLFHNICERKRNGDTRTGCHCAVKPPGCAGKPGQEQQLTPTQLARNDTTLPFCPPPQLERSAVFGRTFHVQAHISCSRLSSWPHALCCSFVVRLCVLVAVPSFFFFTKPYVVLTFCLLISCDRCSPPGGIKFELFIIARESIKSRLVVGHKLMHALFFFLSFVLFFYPHVESHQSRSGKYQDRVCHAWLGVGYQPVR